MHWSPVAAMVGLFVIRHIFIGTTVFMRFHNIKLYFIDVNLHLKLIALTSHTPCVTPVIVCCKTCASEVIHLSVLPK